MLRSAFLDTYEFIKDDAKAEQLWAADFSKESSYGRVMTYQLFTGAVISLWPIVIDVLQRRTSIDRKTAEVRIVRACIPAETEEKVDDDGITIRIHNSK